MNEPWFYALWAGLAYLAGSVSMGDTVSRVAGVDIRALGTGNPGAANIYREIGAPYGVATFLLDIAKGAAVTVPLMLADLPAWASGLAVAALLMGQFFPVFWGFRGNTGMAACMGATAGLLPVGGFLAAPVTLVVIRLSRNTGWTGVLFFALAMLIGGLYHRDGGAVIVLFLGGAMVFGRALIQYGIISRLLGRST